MPETILPNEEELQKLPHAFLVVYAIRCARRAQPLFEAWREATHEHVAAIEAALRAAETLEGVSSSVFEAAAVASAAASNAGAFHSANAAAAAANVANPTEEDSVGFAANAAANANLAFDDARSNGAFADSQTAAQSPVVAAWKDYRALVQMSHKEPRRISFAEYDSALGDLWPEGEPTEITSAKKKAAELNQKRKAEFEQADADAKLNQILDTEIDLLSLSPRARKALAKKEIQTVRDLVEFEEHELLSIANFGATSLNEIKQLLKSLSTPEFEIELGMNKSLEEKTIKLFGRTFPRSKVRAIVDTFDTLRAKIIAMRLGLLDNPKQLGADEIANALGIERKVVYQELQKGAASLRQHLRFAENETPPTRLVFDTSVLNENEIAEFLGNVSKLYAAKTGNHLIIKGTHELDPALVNEPVEAE